MLSTPSGECTAEADLRDFSLVLIRLHLQPKLKSAYKPTKKGGLEYQKIDTRNATEIGIT